MINFNVLKDELLFFVTSKKEYLIDIAKKEYFNDDNYKNSSNFNEWLIHDFKFNGKRVIDFFMLEEEELYNRNKKEYDLFSNSMVSFFEMVITPNNIILKDIFTNKDYMLTNYDGVNENGFLRTRIYIDSTKCYIADDIYYYPLEYKSSFKKIVFEKYNEYCSMNFNISIEEFIKENSILIYKFNDIVEDVISNMISDEEELLVYQSVYTFKDKVDIIEIIENDKNIAKVDDNVYQISIKLQDGENIISEMIVESNRLEIECKTEKDLFATKIYIEEILTKYINFFADEIVSLDSLL